MKKFVMHPDRDQFLQPEKPPGAAFVGQCAVWSLFADSNQTSSVRNVPYKGQTFQIINHLFPFKVKMLEKWDISDSEIMRSLERDSANRSAAEWLLTQTLDSACRELLELGREIYRSFFENFKNLPTAKYQIEHWDAGWWQIKRSLADAGLEQNKLEQIEETKRGISRKICQAAMDLGMVASA